MMYPQEVISEVKALNDIVDVVATYVKLTPRAGNHFGLCPFHSEKTPSFSVNRDKQIFYCFGCGAGGNVLSFVRRVENMDFLEALRLLADRVHFTLPQKGMDSSARKQAAARETAAQLNKRAARFYHDHLNSENADARHAREYLDTRGIKPALVRRFGIGLSPQYWDGLMAHLSDASADDQVAAGLAVKSSKNESQYYDRFRRRLMFPIIDNRNRVVGFGGRIMSEDPDRKEAKYINTPETPLFHKSEQLYGLHLARKLHSGELIIVEGYMDVIAMHQHGFPNTVGVLGTALTDAHARLLRGASCTAVTLILDSDEAGVRAALRAIPILTKGGIKVKVLNITDAKDPDEYLQKFGARRFIKLLSSAKSHIAFQVDLVRQKHDLENTDGRVAFTQEAAEILASLPSAIETDAYVSEIAKMSGISPSAISAEVRKQQGVNSREDAENSIPTRTRVFRPRNEDIGLRNAKKGLLHLILAHPKAANALKKSDFSPEEMGEEIFGQLLTLAFANAEKNSHLSPADIIDFFDETSDQQVVAEIFTNSSEYISDTAISKALNDMAKKIKLAWLYTQMEIEKGDLNAVNSLHLHIKNTTALNITLADG